MPTRRSDSEQQPQKRRASRACSSCNARKIRCDVTGGDLPCTGCRIDNFVCEIPARKRRRKKVDIASIEESSISHRSRAPGDAKEKRSKQAPQSSSTNPGLSQHEIFHQVPHYPFLVEFAQLSTDSRTGIRPSRPPARSQTPSANEMPNLANADSSKELAFLKQRGALDLPDRLVVERFVFHYFHFIHPFFPIIDKTAFLSSYNQMQNDNPGPSLLLLQAVLFSASSLIPLDVLKDAGYATRRQARQSLYKKTKDLYLFDYEPDNVVMVQSLLLMSYYYPSMIEQKHTWHWVHQAISLAQATGMHRDPGNVPQRRLWAQIWWACLVRDRLVSLGTGRPMHINSTDCNVPMPILKDLLESGDDEDDCAVKAMFIEFVKLCQYMEGVLCLRHATTTTASVSLEQVKPYRDALQSWLQSLPPVARRQGESASIGDNANITTLYRAILHQLYNVTIIALHQPYHLLDVNMSTDYQRLKQEVNLAALDTTDIATQLVNLDLVKYCPTYCVTCVLPPLIVHLLEIRASPSRSSKALHTDQYNSCMVYLRELGKIYWHASFYCDFFELAASTDHGLPANSQMQTRDPLIAFLQQQMGHNNKTVPKFVSNTEKRIQNGDSEFPNPPVSRDQPAGPCTSPSIRELEPSDSQVTGSIMLPPIISGIQERSEMEAYKSNQPMSVEMLNGMDDRNRLFDDDIGTDIFAVPSDLQFEEWLSSYGTFQSIFPSA